MRNQFPDSPTSPFFFPLTTNVQKFVIVDLKYMYLGEGVWYDMGGTDTGLTFCTSLTKH